MIPGHPFAPANHLHKYPNLRCIDPRKTKTTSLEQVSLSLFIKIIRSALIHFDFRIKIMIRQIIHFHFQTNKAELVAPATHFSIGIITQKTSPINKQCDSNHLLYSYVSQPRSPFVVSPNNNHMKHQKFTEFGIAVVIVKAHITVIYQLCLIELLFSICVSCLLCCPHFFCWPGILVRIRKCL